MGGLTVNSYDSLPADWQSAMSVEAPNPFPIDGVASEDAVLIERAALDDTRIEAIIRSGLANPEKGLHDSLLAIGHHCAGLSENDVRLRVAPRAKNVADALRGEAVYPLEEVVRKLVDGWTWANAEGIPAASSGNPSRTFDLLDFDALASLPEPSFLIDRFIPKGGISAIIGPPGSGKTHLAVTAAVGVALAVPVLTRAVPAGASGPVVIAAGEGVNGYQRRIAANLPKGMDTPGPLFVIPRAPDLGDDADVASLSDALAGLPETPALLIIDTLSRSIPGLDENSAGDMSSVIRRLDSLRERFPAISILIVAHTTKDDRRGILRGSSALTGALDAIWWLHKASGGLQLTCVKAKEFPEPDPLSLEIFSDEESGSARIGLRDNPTTVAPEIRTIVGFTRDATRDNEGTVPNIAAAAGSPTETVRGHLKRAERQGWLESRQDAHRKGKPRIYALTERGEELSRDATD